MTSEDLIQQYRSAVLNHDADKTNAGKQLFLVTAHEALLEALQGRRS